MKIIVILFLGVIYFQTQAQEFKFGAISREEIEMTHCNFDSLASAVILADIGTTTASSQWGTRFKRYTRIKILKQEAINEFGNLKVISGIFSLSKVNFAVHNLEDNKVITTSFDPSSVFESKIQDKYNQFAIAFPNVKVGSVIEVTFTLSANYVTVPTWNFQQTIPVVYSEYTLENFSRNSFNPILIGPFKPTISKNPEKKRQQWVLTAIPAFKEEPFMPPSDPYIGAISFGFVNFGESKSIPRTPDGRDPMNSITVESSLKLNSDGKLNGIINLTRKAIAAHRARANFKKTDREAYINYSLPFKNWDITTLEIKNIEEDNPEINVIESYEVTIPDYTYQREDVIYINPFITLKDEVNPFLSETRLYPIYFDVPFEKVVISEIVIPEGYIIEEVPAKKILTLPDQSAKFIFDITANKNLIRTTCYIKITRTLYRPSEYGVLREFYARMIAKQAEVIVIKKL